MFGQKKTKFSCLSIKSQFGMPFHFLNYCMVAGIWELTGSYLSRPTPHTVYVKADRFRSRNFTTVAGYVLLSFTQRNNTLLRKVDGGAVSSSNPVTIVVM